jgi:hypothetical protein
VGIYFRTETRRLTFRELWGIHPRFPVFLAACVMKVFRLPGSRRMAALHEEVIRAIPADRVPAAALRKLGPPAEEFQRLGARLAFYHTVSGTGPMQGCAAVLLPPEHNAVISVTWATARATGPGSEANLAIASELRDGTYLATSGNRLRFHPPPGVTVFRYRGAPPSELLSRHQQHLAQGPTLPMPVENAGQAEQVLLGMKRHSFEWNVRRGIWVPLAPEELVALGVSANP